jgi:hypothetical protein
MCSCGRQILYSRHSHDTVQHLQHYTLLETRGPALRRWCSLSPPSLLPHSRPVSSATRAGVQPRAPCSWRCKCKRAVHGADAFFSCTGFAMPVPMPAAAVLCQMARLGPSTQPLVRGAARVTRSPPAPPPYESHVSGRTSSTRRAAHCSWFSWMRSRCAAIFSLCSWVVSLPAMAAP